MAITNYTNLQTAIANWLNRDDLTAVIPSFISLAEAKFSRRFKDFQPLSNTNATNWILTNNPDVYLYGALVEASPYLADNEQTAIWAQLYSAALVNLRGPFLNADFSDYSGLQLAVSDWLMRADLDAAVPQFITLAEAKFKRRFRDVPALSSGNPSNWILEDHPDLYLYGALVEAEPYLKNDARIPVWRGLYDVEIARVRKPDVNADFDNYAGLRSVISEFLMRTDLDPIIPQFIQLAEAQFNRDIRHWRMEARATTEQGAGDEYVQVPGDWLETIRMHVIGGGTTPLKLISRAAMADIRSKNLDQTGRPQYYTHVDSQFRLYPTPDDGYDIELLYTTKIPALATNGQNWLLEYAPDVYLYGSLIHSAPYLQEDPRTATWAQLYSAAVARLNDESDKARYSGSGLTMKIRGLG